jgi:hypothetical protein
LESALPGYLDEARAVLTAAPRAPADADLVAAGLSPDFEYLRWFELPSHCLS